VDKYVVGILRSVYTLHMREENHLSKNTLVIIGIILIVGLFLYIDKYRVTHDGSNDTVQNNVDTGGTAIKESPYRVVQSPGEIIIEQGSIEDKVVRISVSPDEGFSGTLMFSIEDILTEAGESLLADRYLPVYFPVPDLVITNNETQEVLLILAPTFNIPKGDLIVVYEITSASSHYQGTDLFIVPVTVN